MSENNIETCPLCREQHETMSLFGMTYIACPRTPKDTIMPIGSSKAGNIMNQIPRAIIERDKQGVERLTYYGVPVTELDRDGLLAALNISERKAQMGFANFNDMMAFNRFVSAKSYSVTSNSE